MQYKHVYYNFQKPNLTYSNCLFILKNPEIFSLKSNKTKKKIKNLKLESVTSFGIFVLKNYLNDELIIKIVVIHFLSFN